MSAAVYLFGKTAMFENSLPNRAGAKASLSELMMENTLNPAAEPSISASALGELWERVRRKLRAELGDDVVASWFGSLELAGIDGGVARLSVPTRFLKSWIDTHYAERLRKHFAVDGNAVNVEVRVRGATPQRTSVTRITTRLAEGTAPCEIATSFPRPQPRPMLDGRRDKRQQEISMPLSVAAALDRQLTFDNFVVGRSNQFACSAARKVGETVGGQAVYNPLYIHAAVGLGKTHLAQAMAHACESRGTRALYLTACTVSSRPCARRRRSNSRTRCAISIF